MCAGQIRLCPAQNDQKGVRATTAKSGIFLVWVFCRRPQGSCLITKVARRRTRLRSWGAGRAVTSPKRRPDDLPRPRSSHLSQIARQISLVPMGAAHRTPTTCHLHRFASSGHPVRVRLSAGWPEVEMAVMWAALPRSGTCGRLGDHKMGGSDASHLYLRSGAASGVTPPRPLACRPRTQRKPPAAARARSMTRKKHA